MTVTTIKTGSIARNRQSILLWLWQNFRDWARRRAQQRTDRDAFNTLLYLDEATLRDIGYSRGDVVEASQWPLSVNAAQVLDSRRSKSHRSRYGIRSASIPQELMLR